MFFIHISSDRSQLINSNKLIKDQQSTLFTHILLILVQILYILMHDNSVEVIGFLLISESKRKIES